MGDSDRSRGHTAAGDRPREHTGRRDRGSKRSPAHRDRAVSPHGSSGLSCVRGRGAYLPGRSEATASRDLARRQHGGVHTFPVGDRRGSAGGRDTAHRATHGRQQIRWTRGAEYRRTRRLSAAFHLPAQRGSLDCRPEGGEPFANVGLLPPRPARRTKAFRSAGWPISPADSSRGAGVGMEPSRARAPTRA